MKRLTLTRYGFALIELLVVVAIISMLASITLVALNTIRNRGKFAAIQANLSTVKSEADLYYVGNSNGYGTPVPTSFACSGDVFSHSVIPAALTEAIKNGSTVANDDKRCAIGLGGQTWAVSIPLAGGGNWCVTSGDSVYGTAAGGGSGAVAYCDPDNN